MAINTNRYFIKGNETEIVIRDKAKVLISTESLEIVKSYTWCLEGTGYVMSRSKGPAVKLHRVILDVGPGVHVDHVDGDPLNNRLENLRVCTKQENAFNTKVRSDNTSGYKGVCWVPKLKKYRAYINRSGKQFNLGLYIDKDEAAQAYNRKAEELFGEFARLNVIDKD